MDISYFKKRNFYIKKVEPGIASFEINKNIDQHFRDPNKYLSYESNLIIGRKVTGPRYDLENKVIPFSIIGSVKDFQGDLSQNKVLTASIKTTNIQKKLSEYAEEKKNYVNISDNELNSVCQTTQNRIFNNKLTNVNDFLRKVPQVAKEKLINQEKILERKDNHQRQKEHLTRALSNYSKKNPNDLLLNKSEFYRQKKEIRESVESSRPLDQRYGFHSWIMSLRRPEDFKGTRFVHINIGSNERPVWRMVKEYVSNDIEKNKKPLSSIPVKTANSFFKTEKTKSRINSGENLEKLEIIGNNLLSEEFRILSGLKGRKIMFNSDGENPVKHDEVISEMYIENKSKKSRKRIKSECRLNFKKD